MVMQQTTAAMKAHRLHAKHNNHRCRSH